MVAIKLVNKSHFLKFHVAITERSIENFKQVIC